MQVTKSFRRDVAAGFERLAAEGGQAAPVRRLTVSEGLREQDRELVAAGFPPISPWWWEQIEKFYGQGKRQGVWRVGRGGGKSTTGCRVAVAEVRFGDHPLGPGDLGVCPIISVSREEAADRLETLRAILAACRVPFTPSGQTLAITGRPIEFRVYPCTISGVSGFTTLFALCDEVAKWRNSQGANPAREVLASLRPTLRGRPNSKIWLLSSPLGTLDAHAAAFDEGETPQQSVAVAPTWIANPTLSEAQTHIEEPNEDIWRREWAAIPVEGNVESLFSGALLDRAQEGWQPHGPARPGWTYVAAMDPATRGNAWTLVVATTDGVRRHVVLWKEWRAPQTQKDPEGVFREIAKLIHPYDVRIVHTDQWGFDYGAALARRPHEIDMGLHWSLTLSLHAITHTNKLPLYEGLAMALQDQRVCLPPDKVIRADLLGVHRRITSTGQSLQLVNTADGRHSDYAQPIAMVCDMLHIPPPRAVPASATEAIEQAVERAELKRHGEKDRGLLGLKKQRALRKLPR